MRNMDDLIKLEHLYSLLPKHLCTEYSGSIEQLGDTVLVYKRGKPVPKVADKKIQFTTPEDTLEVIKRIAPKDWHYFAGTLDDTGDLIFHVS